MPTDYSTDFWPQETLRQTPTPKPPKKNLIQKQTIYKSLSHHLFFPPSSTNISTSQATPWRHPSPSLFHSGKAARCVASPGAAEHPGAGARNGSAATGGAMAPSAPRGHRRPSGARWRGPGYRWSDLSGAIWGSIPIKIPLLYSGMNIHKSQLFWGEQKVPGF